MHPIQDGSTTSGRRVCCLGIVCGLNLNPHSGNPFEPLTKLSSSSTPCSRSLNRSPHSHKQRRGHRSKLGRREQHQDALKSLALGNTKFFSLCNGRGTGPGQSRQPVYTTEKAPVSVDKDGKYTKPSSNTALPDVISTITAAIPWAPVASSRYRPS